MALVSVSVELIEARYDVRAIAAVESLLDTLEADFTTREAVAAFLDHKYLMNNVRAKEGDGDGGC